MKIIKGSKPALTLVDHVYAKVEELKELTKKPNCARADLEEIMVDMAKASDLLNHYFSLFETFLEEEDKPAATKKSRRS